MVFETTLRNLTLDDMEAIAKALAENVAHEADLLQSINSAFRDKQRIEQIDDWRKAINQFETNQIINGQQETAIAIGQDLARDETKGFENETTALMKAGTVLAKAETVLAKEGAVLEQDALRHVTNQRQEIARRAKEAENEFWKSLPDLIVPPGMIFVPFHNSKLFTAAECNESPTQESARYWFQMLCEQQEIAQAVASAPQNNRSWRETRKQISRIHRRFRHADAAWNTHSNIFRAALGEISNINQEVSNINQYDKVPRGMYASRISETRSQGARSSKVNWKKKPIKAAEAASMAVSTDWLAAWVLAKVGDKYLRPLIMQSSPNATSKQLRQQLTLEIWGEVLSLRAYRLSITAFCSLPATVARSVRELHSSTGGTVGLLKPETQRRLLDMSTAEPNPLASVIEAEAVENIMASIRTLPRQQRRSMELLLLEYTRQEMAEMLNCKPESVKTHLERARLYLANERTLANKREIGILKKENP